MNTGRKTIPTLAMLAAAIALALPANAETFYDVARVLDVRPIYEARQVPVKTEECGYEQSSTPRPADPAWQGDARIADPDAGLFDALLQDIELREPAAPAYRCRMVTRMTSKEVPAGYQVRYEYGGQIHEKQVTERPGDNIRVKVRLGASESRVSRWR